MTSAGLELLSEEPVQGAVPRWEIPGWRERYGVVAGVTGRGTEPGPDFDLGLRTAAPVGEVMDRWRRFLGAEPGFPGAVLARQVHGRVVMSHSGRYPGWLQVEGVDGHVTGADGLLLLVTVADCVPIYLVDTVSKVIALLHAGWRGAAEGILAAGLDCMSRVHACSVENIVMHCGVAISGPCYEVGNEVTDRLGLPPDRSGRQYLDLRSVLASQAASLGIRRVSLSGHCTARDAGHFFSHRRSRGRDGRQVAYIGRSAGPTVQPLGDT